MAIEYIAIAVESLCVAPSIDWIYPHPSSNNK